MDTFETFMLVCCLTVVAYHFWRDASAKSVEGATDKTMLLVGGLAGAVALLVLTVLLWSHAWRSL